MKDKYVFGIDFGTESARGVLVSTKSGEVIASAVSYYPHGVITERLPESGELLEPNWVLQHPGDYLYVLKDIAKQCLKGSKVNVQDVIGIGIDFTASTILPIFKSGVPLCFDQKYKKNPHSWVKLWKHHAAHKQAQLINKVALERNEPFLRRYGGEISEEWMLPKILQILHESPEIYDAADKFIEAGDWIVMQLVGEEKRSSCMAGYKGLWSKHEGFPSKEYLKFVHPRFENLIGEKLSDNIYPIGSRAGFLSRKMALELGLTESVAVSVAIIDAHASLLGAGINKPRTMVMAMGTSICHMCVDKREIFVPGISGVVEDGILPGYFGYEAGQSAGGDLLSWFVKNGAPAHLMREATSEKSIYCVLEEEASRLRPGENGLIALDWWNGNRSVLKDPNLTGLIVGFTLQTKPEHIYRALMESLGFGTKKILNAFVENGINIDEIYACGGLAEKNRLLMQLLADITGKNVHVVTLPHTCAMGAAVLAAVAAGKTRGGWDTIEEAQRHMIHYEPIVYEVNEENRKIYDQLFIQYEFLYDYFGRAKLMKNLLSIKNEEFV
ncbi:ribulokinase [Geobacillus thermoleovorans]|uniref:ribulokinase n=1 Tax=Geobacillus TaxID=129337 RepID=UPI0004738669|nr:MULTISPECIES: ribulokinase [Geobacillus]MCG6794032.1 ribulokinase [Geobacillus sp. YHL]UPT59451.1 ribulokinase [Geobacillus thermoleovorans]